MKKMNKKGFTLMEMLIVVAIIAVLIAIAIPVFTAQLEKAREAVDAANLRAAYADVLSQVMMGKTSANAEVIQKQTVSGWSDTTFTDQWPGNFSVDPPTSNSGSWTVTATSDGEVAAAYTGD